MTCVLLSFLDDGPKTYCSLADGCPSSKFVSLLNCAVDTVMQVVPIQPHNGGYVSSLYGLCLTVSDNIAISMRFELTHSLFGCCARGGSVSYSV